MTTNPHLPGISNVQLPGSGTDSEISLGPPVLPHQRSSERVDSATELNSTSGADPSVDEQLIQRTKLQIRALVKEIADLAKSANSIEDFYQGFLTKTVSALASVGGAIWVKPTSDSPLQLGYQINLKQTGIVENAQAQQQHGLLLNQLLESGEPDLVAPLSGTEQSTDAGNPTEFLLIVGTLKIDQETTGLVEIFQRPGAGPATQRGYLRFLSQMCEIASDFLRTQQLRTFQEQQLVWQQLEQFIRQVHCGLDTDQTAYSIANEGRRLLDCDRVSVAILEGQRATIRAVSGLDSIERRADQVKKLGALASRVIRAGQPLWYAGDDDDLPPQIEKRLHEYVDRSHTKLLAIIPLAQVDPEASEESSLEKSARPKPAKMLGALIIEHLTDSTIQESLKKRVQVVTEHSELALSNTSEYNSIFMMPVWRALGKATSLVRGGNLVKTVSVVLALVVIGAFLSLFPYPFALGSKGRLTPETQHEVFALVDGVLTDILVSDNADSLVSKGQLLARMTNSDLMLEIENLDGELQRVRKSLGAMLRARNQEMSHYERILLNGEYSEALETQKSLEQKLKIKRAEAESLNVVSPADGQVINWQIRQNLLRRPVNRGQKLMTVVDPNTVWQIELEMPERRVSHLIEANQQSEDGLDVTFALASYPGKEFRGKLLSIDQQLNVYSDEGNSVLVRVQFENDQVPKDLLRSGTRVKAQVQCGERSIGYVVFHDLIETIQSTFLFWF